MVTLGLRRGEAGAIAIAAASRAALAHAGVMEDGAELWITECNARGVALGAFQRARGLTLPRAPLARRGSGGPAVLVGAGSLHVALVLSRPDALTPCDAPRLVNRYVRPLLGALTASGAAAQWFGRDWIRAGGGPAAWVGFGHDASSGRAVIEAFLPLRESFAIDGGRASYRGQRPRTLDEASGRALSPSVLAAAIAASYASAYDATITPRDGGALPASPEDDDPRADPAWAATLEEPIGTLAAGPDARGRLRVGGDLLASRDALSALERLLWAAPVATDDAIARRVEETLGAPGVVVEGVRSLARVAAVIAEARRRI